MVLLIAILSETYNFFVQRDTSEKTISFMQNTRHIVLRAKLHLADNFYCTIAISEENPLSRSRDVSCRLTGNTCPHHYVHYEKIT
jgi:hypothetical protein